MRGAARLLKITPKAVRKRRVRLAELGRLGFDPVLPGYQIHSINTGPKGTSVRQVKASGEEFEIPPGFMLSRVSANVDAEGRWRGGWRIATPDKAAQYEAFKIAVDELKRDLPRVAPTPMPDGNNDLLLNQYTVTDHHFGMRAWHEETRSESYDLDIAEQIWTDWFAAAVEMAPDASTAVLAQLGDLLHYDSMLAITPTSGHILDADSRLQKMIRVVIRVLRRTIDALLEKHDRLHIVMAAGNHDPASSAWLREMLAAMYEHEPRVSVDDTPGLYYAYEFGNVSLFYHHGHRRKIAEVAETFAASFREMYGRTRHSYGHTGHLHKGGLDERSLMPIEQHRTLASPDAYAAGGGWLAGRDAKVITYHKEFGEVSRLTLSPQMVSRRAEALRV